MNDFWISSGHHLLDRGSDGGLHVTDEFLKLYLARPELIPPAEACAVERTLHAALLADPRMPVSASDIDAIADADARENWKLMIAFRDHLLRHKTLEAAFRELVRGGFGNVPPLFINQLVHVILRNALDGIEDAWVLRAAELFFRTQRVTLHEGSLIVADEETIGGVNTTPVTPLVSMLGIPAESEIDVINKENADSYWDRSDQFDMALDLTAGREGLDALAQAMQRWIAHLLGINVSIEALPELQDVDLTWYVGLDADATRIGDMLWHGEEIDEATMARVVGLFRLTFCRSVVDGREGQGRSGLSDPGDDGRQDDPHEAAKPADRLAGAASGGGQLSAYHRLRVTRSALSSSAARARAVGSTFTGAPSACLSAFLTRRHGPSCPMMASARPFTPARQPSNCIGRKRRTIATTCRWKRRNCGSSCVRSSAILLTSLPSVTADPAEGEAMTETGEQIVESVPMPKPMQDAIAAFVAEHHVEQAFVKRKRDRANPDALARRGPPIREDRK